MSTRLALVPVLCLVLGLAACGGGSDGTGVVSRPQYQETVVVEGVGGSEDIRFNPIGTLFVESVGREIFLLERAFVGAIVLRAPAGFRGGGNQVNFDRAAEAGRIDIFTDGNVLYFAPGSSGGDVTIFGNGNTIYVEPAASLSVDDQGSDNVIVGL